MNAPPRAEGASLSGAPSLALTFLFAGLGYACPLFLFPASHPLNGPTSPEVLNLYFLVAWMGLAHFAFAYNGQARALRRGDSRTAVLFPLGVLISAGVLWGARRAIGSTLFDMLVWIYFIPHFIKAELHFSRTYDDAESGGWVLYWFPALGFAFLTAAIFAPVAWTQNGWSLWAGALLCAGAGLLGGIRRQLRSPALSTYALLAFFFIGEGLVWGTYSKYMSPQFRQGVYVFHIAVASFYHYFHSYAFALKRLAVRAMEQTYMLKIAAVNLGSIALGWIVVQHLWRPARWVFDMPYFTFWVGLHLAASDLFNRLRR